MHRLPPGELTPSFVSHGTPEAHDAFKVYLHQRPLVAASDQLEQHTRFGLILADVDDVIEDQQMILVELGECTFERELAARDLQALDEIAGSHEQHAPSVLDECEADGGRKMALASAGRTEQQEIGALLEPA